MPIHFGPRLHKFTHSLFKPRDEVETTELYNKVADHFLLHGITDSDERAREISALSQCVSEGVSLDTGSPRYEALKSFVQRVMDYEGIWWLPEIDWTIKRETSDWWEIREALNQQYNWIQDFDATFNLIADALIIVFEPIAQIWTETDTNDAFELTVETSLLNRVSGLSEALEHMLSILNAQELVEAGLFERTRDQFERNVIVASGGNLTDPRSFSKMPVLPTRSQIKDPKEMAEAYLGATPFIDFLSQSTLLVIPTKTRFEHMHVVAGTGHGKSQTLQYLIAQDLPAVAAGQRSVIVIDSQGDLIRTISQLEEFAPGGRLADRLVLIDPTDVEYPVSLNLFDVGKDRLDSYEALERERLTNSILELYDFVLGTLLDAGMTQKQSVIFRYVTRLMLHIDGATIHTLRELMEEGSEIRFANDIAKLSGSARHFFETEFADREFKQTRKQVLRRLWGILENQTFERMFSHPKSKLDLFSEMNAGKVILINSAKDLLKEQGTQIFGRFFIAMIAQAAQERATLAASKRLPTFVYVDEAADYFDRNIGIILSQARKYNVGMVLAHQYLGQLDGKLQEAFSANTSIKVAGGVSNKDARALAPMMYCQPDLIETQPKGSFATFIRGTTASALPLKFPFGHMEAMDRMSAEQAKSVRSEMRSKFAVHISQLGKPEAPEGDEGSAPETDETSAKNTAKPEPKSDDPSPDIDIDPSEDW
jgi:uncharacterized protein DUF87